MSQVTQLPALAPEYRGSPEWLEGEVDRLLVRIQALEAQLEEARSDIECLEADVMGQSRELGELLHENQSLAQRLELFKLAFSHKLGQPSGR